jgi:hypothetical protein
MLFELLQRVRGPLFSRGHGRAGFGKLPLLTGEPE